MADGTADDFYDLYTSGGGTLPGGQLAPPGPPSTPVGGGDSGFDPTKLVTSLAGAAQGITQSVIAGQTAPQIAQIQAAAQVQIAQAQAAAALAQARANQGQPAVQAAATPSLPPPPVVTQDAAQQAAVKLAQGANSATQPAAGISTPVKVAGGVLVATALGFLGYSVAKSR